MSNSLDAIRADQANFLDGTEDEVKEVPSSVVGDSAVEAMVTHINKYDVPDEKEGKRS